MSAISTEEKVENRLAVKTLQVGDKQCLVQREKSEEWSERSKLLNKAIICSMKKNCAASVWYVKKIETQFSEKKLYFICSEVGFALPHTALHRHIRPTPSSSQCVEADRAQTVCGLQMTPVGDFMQVAETSSGKNEVQLSQIKLKFTFSITVSVHL